MTLFVQKYRLFLSYLPECAMDEKYWKLITNVQPELVPKIVDSKCLDELIHHLETIELNEGCGLTTKNIAAVRVSCKKLKLCLIRIHKFIDFI